MNTFLIKAAKKLTSKALIVAVTLQTLVNTTYAISDQGQVLGAKTNLIDTTNNGPIATLWMFLIGILVVGTILYLVYRNRRNS